MMRHRARGRYRRAYDEWASHFAGSSSSTAPGATHRIYDPADVNDNVLKIKNYWGQVHLSTDRPSTGVTRVQWAGYCGLMRWPGAEVISVSEIAIDDPRLIRPKTFAISGHNNAIVLDYYCLGVNITPSDELNFVLKLTNWPSDTDEELTFQLMAKFVESQE